VKFHIKSVVLDPDFKVLHWTPEYREEATVLAPYWQGLSKWQQGKSADAQEVFKTALERIPASDPYAARFMFEEGWARVLQGDKALTKDKKFNAMKTHLEKALASPTRRADRLPWVYFLLATVAKQLNDEATLRWAVEGAISADNALGGRTGWGSAARTLLP
jgi:tetratricopeptide (TPR) repeat protein